MDLEIYIGNYPSTFTSVDLLNLFQDFKGVELRINKNVNKKCFAFLRCLDKQQVVNIVTTMRDIDVCGRNLIVRACDKELNKLIVESLLEKNDGVDTYPPRNTHHSVCNRFCNENQSSSRFISKEVFKRGFIKEADFPVGLRFRNPLLNSSNLEIKSDSVSQLSKCEIGTIPSLKNLTIHDTVMSKWNGSSQNVPEVEASSVQAYKHITTKSVCDKKSSHEYEHIFKKSSNIVKENVANYASGSPSHESQQNINDFSNSASYSGSSKYKMGNILNDDIGSDRACLPECLNESTKFHFVSVSNFPFGTTICHLYDHFEDIDPYNIVMIRNFQLEDGRPTEAILCLESEDQVTDAIMNFDNTIFYGRVLLVTDAADPSLLGALLDINAKNV